MKIAFFTNNYLPNIYGVPMSIETFRKELEARGHEVFIFAPDFPGYADENKNVFRYPSLDINIRFRLPLAIPYSSKMDKILEKLDLDLIHSHHPNLLGTAARKWAEKKNVPLVFTWHTLYDRYTNFVPFLPARYAADWIIRKAVQYANSAAVVIVPTGSVEPIIRKWGVKNDISAVATGIVEEEFANPDGKSIRKKYGIAADEILLLLISRLTEEKNIDFVFRAALQIIRTDSKVKFMLAGTGYLKDNLEKEIKRQGLENKVISVGLIERGKLKDHYAAADIFIYGSKSETQGMIVSEAMYSALPIVAVDAPGVQSLVESGVNGLLVSENENDFIGAIKKLIADPALRARMSSESRRIAKEKYTAAICAEKMLEIYKKAIEKR